MDSSPYPVHDFRDVTVTEVQPDERRLFLVVSGTRSRTGRPCTLVLERQSDYWISRRDLDGLYAPAEAVSGFLFNREGYKDLAFFPCHEELTHRRGMQYRAERGDFTRRRHRAQREDSEQRVRVHGVRSRG